jgi:hypothetical protein
MSLLAKVLSLSYDNAEATITSALKSYYRSVRLIKDSGTIAPNQDSRYTNILLCGNCVDPATRNLYVFYIDIFYGAAWIIEINIDSRVQTVVYYDKLNNIGFDPLHKIYNPRVVFGRIIWTDNRNPIYQMDVARAKQSFNLGIGYGQNEVMAEWSAITSYPTGRIVSNGNNFYEALSYNKGVEPRLDSDTIWKKLCLIEDAYYSMNVQNFYFEPMPPKHPPEVAYQSDDSRKVNNLRQTLFQCAYRYVYMDWRRSTFSPASIVPVPQAEEETATGLANEQISLNNKLQIVFNSGGEEVRAIEIIGRSSQDPSKWFLIDTIYKFEEQERGNEISRISLPGYVGLGLSVEPPSVSGINIPTPSQDQLAISLPSPNVLNTWVYSTLSITGWTAAENGVSAGKTSVITSSYLEARIGAIPDWLVVLYNGFPLVEGMTVNSGSVITIYPNAPNTGVQRTGIITFTNQMGDFATITCIQAAIPPVVVVTPTIVVDPNDTSGMTLGDKNALGQSWNTNVNLYFVIDVPGYTSGQTLNVYWRAVVNGNNYGNGIMYNCTDILPNTASISLSQPLMDGDTAITYLTVIPSISGNPNKVGVTIAPQPPSVVNSSISVSNSIMGWVATEYGIGVEKASVITSSPITNTVQVVAIPSWLTLQNQWSNLVNVGQSLNSGDTLYAFPKVENLGNQKDDYIIIKNSYNDIVYIHVTQAAAITPPPGQPVATQVLVDPNLGGLTIIGYTANALSGSTTIMIDASVNVPGVLAGVTTSVHWRATINGVQQGFGDIYPLMRNQTYEIRTIVLNTAPQVGDTVIIYLSH